MISALINAASGAQRVVIKISASPVHSNLIPILLTTFQLMSNEIVNP